MKRSALLWILAVLITLISAVYQRLTGPTHPMRSTITLDGRTTTCKLPRAHIIGESAVVSIPAGSGSGQAILFYRRHNSGDAWSTLPMPSGNGRFAAVLPQQPTGGKMQYYIEYTRDGQTQRLPAQGVVVTRFRYAVPASVLIPHILIMFFGMLLSTRAGLEALNRGTVLNRWVWWTLGLLFTGGMVLGPLVQHAAFGEWWTGIPFGTDLTDNKTLIALVVWLIAALHLRRPDRVRTWVLIAAVVTLVAFAIPHSVMGTEVDHLRSATTAQP
ncbi:MAG TPA: hypothetical protein PKI62_13165 [bacterium]|nr:hypothetical protein [bacterium]HPR89101.1 hypothetical protein [bacterium]